MTEGVFLINAEHNYELYEEIGRTLWSMYPMKAVPYRRCTLYNIHPMKYVPYGAVYNRCMEMIFASVRNTNVKVQRLSLYLFLQTSLSPLFLSLVLSYFFLYSCIT